MLRIVSGSSHSKTQETAGSRRDRRDCRPSVAVVSAAGIHGRTHPKWMQHATLHSQLEKPCFKGLNVQLEIG